MDHKDIEEEISCNTGVHKIVIGAVVRKLEGVIEDIMKERGCYDLGGIVIGYQYKKHMSKGYYRKLRHKQGVVEIEEEIKTINNNLVIKEVRDGKEKYRYGKREAVLDKGGDGGKS